MNKTERRANSMESVKAGIMKMVDCTPEENTKYLAMSKEDLPDDVFRKATSDNKPLDGFFRFIPAEQIDVLIKQAKDIGTIKNILVFWMALTILGIFVSIIMVLSALS